MHNSWTVADILSLFLIVVFVIALVLVLSVVTKKSCELEADRANTIRAQLLTLLAIAMGVLVLCAYRTQLSDAVHNLMD